ncbi:helix-turn-helix domain-containing protein [Rhodococcus opacus]|uniref:helix-turn-helix domain-containing protein n=1 Tax=Rhodococcus opacus TaxID=37919 RepID=UPI0029547FD5|nr:helix-turn-helix domain-containing protein [Rhodococcus opacus]MDV7088037.1 helix-turn-helix domain-containing protein [Rhodococcus opacus]
MQLRYKFRLYPTPGQQLALARAFGCARVVFNDALRARIDAHEAGLPFRLTGNCRVASLPRPRRHPNVHGCARCLPWCCNRR